jgi:hypothetical protein
MRLRSLVSIATALLTACTPPQPEPPAPPQPQAAQAPPAADAESLRAAPTPRLADGRPDLNGTWAHAGGGVLGLELVAPETLPDGSVCVFGCGGEQDEQGDAASEEESFPPEDVFPPPEPSFPSYKTELQAKVDALRESQVETDTVLRCYPPGVPRIGPPGKIVQTASEVVFLYNDYNGGYFRLVPLDGARTEQPPSHLGQAVGRFDGDVLVVETTRFTTDTWLTDNGAFHTAELRVVERLRRLGDTIDYEAVAHDPAVLTEPWVARTQTLWRVAGDLEAPVPCEERDLPHMTDRSYHENPR